MKRQKLFIVITLIIVMMISYAVPTIAATGDVTSASTSNISVSTGNEGDILYGYKVIDAEIDPNTNALNFTFSSKFNEFINSTEGASYQSLKPEDYMDKNQYGNDSEALNTLLGKFTKYVKQEGTTPDITSKTVTNGIGVFENAPLGQYIIVGAGNSQGALIYQTVTAEVVPTHENNVYSLEAEINVTMKTSEATMTKSMSGTTTDGTRETASIGEDITYTLESYVPTYPVDSTNTTYYLADTLSEGLTLTTEQANFVVKGDDQTLPQDAYTVSIEGQNIFVDFKFDSIKAYNKVSVQYTAQLNEKASIGTTTGNVNTAKLVYSNAPYNGTTSATHSEGNGYNTETDEKTVYTYNLVIDKYDTKDNTKKLEGAVFELYANEACTGTPIATLTTDATGKATVKEIKSGTFYLKEIKAPAGYKVLVDPITVNISANSTNFKDNMNYVQEIENTEGGTLPTTGGIGTIIFTVVGICLAGGAAILLITKKRFNKNN